MGKPRQIVISDSWGHSGISIEYTKCRRELYFFGWYDSYVGIEGGAMTLCDFLDTLGITLKDVEKSYEEHTKKAKAKKQESEDLPESH